MTDSASLVCARKTLNSGLGAFINALTSFLGSLYCLLHPEHRTPNPIVAHSSSQAILSDLKEEEEGEIIEASRSGLGSEDLGNISEYLKVISCFSLLDLLWL